MLSNNRCGFFCYRHAKIVTKTIRGYTKYAGYGFSEPFFEGTKTDWTAVLINEEWYLVDINWSLPHVTGGSDEWHVLDADGNITEDVTNNDKVEELRYTYNEYYFLTNPEEFIYSHFPTDSRWQLLARAVKPEKFQQMAYLRPGFFPVRLAARESYKMYDRGLGWLSHCKAGIWRVMHIHVSLVDLYKRRSNNDVTCA